TSSLPVTHLSFSSPLLPPPPRSTLFPYTTLFRSLQKSRSHARSARRRWLVPHRRHRLSRQGQLSLHHRSQEGLDQDRGGKICSPATHRKRSQDQPLHPQRHGRGR